MIRTVVRRSAVALALVTVFGMSLALAGGPASADTPTPSPGSWEPKPQVNDLHALLTFVGIPILVLLVVSALVLAPSLARGESLLPKSQPEPGGQWLGGPRKAVGELADPDSEDSAAGGAGATW